MTSMRETEQGEQYEQNKHRRRQRACDPSNACTASETMTSTTPSLASLALPWAVVVGIAVIMAMNTSEDSSLEEHYTTLQDEDEGMSIRVLQRMLSVVGLSSNSNSQSQPYAPYFNEHKAVSQSQPHAPHFHEHKPVFNEEHGPLFPLTNNDFLGFGCAVIGLMVAAGGGIGGGGILVPIYILVMGFTPKHAIPLSNVTVFGGAIANTLLNNRKRHPLADRPLVDWDLILVMEPLTIAGALMGALLNKVLPETFLTILLVVLLSFTAQNSLTKAFKMYRKETKAFLEQAGLREDGTQLSELTRMAHETDDGDEEEAEDTLLEHMEAEDDGEENDADDDDEVKRKVLLQKDQAAQYKLELQDILEEEKVAPKLNIVILVTMFVVVMVMNLLKGGGAFPSPIGIKCGSTSFWMANLFMLAWIVLISFFVRAYLVRQYEIKKRCNYPYVEGDIEWTSRSTIIYPCICCLAGFMAGMFGVGGGIVKGPLMLAMNVHPAVSSGTSATMILFTSFTATTSFVVFGLLLPDYAVVCLIVGFVATLVGQLGLSYLMRKSQRNSYIAFSIGGVVFLSAILMTIQSLLSMASGEKHKAGGICGLDH
jgi:uncharacterized membrane protein YfcA